MAQGNEDGAGWLRLSLDKKGFKKPAPVSYRMFDGLRTSWKVAGLITEHAGYPGQAGLRQSRSICRENDALPRYAQAPQDF